MYYLFIYFDLVSRNRECIYEIFFLNRVYRTRQETQKKSMGAAAILRLTKRNKIENNTDS